MIETNMDGVPRRPALPGWLVVACCLLLVTRQALAGDGGGGNVGDVPEIDGGSALSALTVLGGGLLLLGDRIRKHLSSR
ncbi:hypothetical protein [Tautonia plasticadhaerens]|uniref:VPDSG-CTERM protein sorting domain-containing protein n=1 Tax=Tautonia plasticadhaerens TaxID=2527974 RepID=A0A518HC21_9BACT|nr:hypothetical protein [Tautonia plasticadhaerens]QDV38413.1 hypothetical protein ElP_63680 [Tautonia plasticadhaerens]